LDAGRTEDREIFAGIVRRYQNLVTALTFSMTGNLQQSEDLAQETFVAAWRRLTGGESRPEVPMEKLGAWLCGIARNLTNNWLRRTTRERQTPHIPVEADMVADLTVDVPTATDPDDDFEKISRETQATLVWETLRHIPVTYREPLVMFYRQDASIREIADALGLTEACVKQRISRGRTMLKGEIANRFESFLTQIRPGEHFTVAVLAAIPILATGKQAMAASSAGIAAAQTASSGGGHPLIAGITASCWKFVCGVGPFLTVFIGTILGVWSGVRHAPTRRARLLMLRTVLEYYVFCSCITVFCVLYVAYIYKLAIDIDTLRRFQWFCIGGMPILILLNSICVNRQWRQCVEFDSGIGDKEPKTITLRYLIGLLISALAFNAVLLVIVIRVMYFEMGAVYRWYEWMIMFSPSTAAILFLYCGWQISRNDAAFAKYPPQQPNLLPILTGEQICPKGFRNRINFWGDLTGIGFGMVCMQVFSVGFYFQHRALERLGMTLLGIPIGNGSNLLLGLSLVMYLGFVVFFAGIPRRRWWGMILLAGTILICNTFMICYAKLWQHVASQEFAMVFGMNAWYLLCFALAGVAGLWVFRKQPPGR